MTLASESAASKPSVSELSIDERLAALLLKDELTELLHLEADLLDEQRFDEWLELLDDDVIYTMPLRLNVHHADASRASTEDGDVSWFEDDLSTLRMRVEQLATGEHWAEEPRSRVSHLVSNIRLLSVVPGPETPAEVEVGCRFLVYRNRVADETDIWVGRRTDTWRVDPEGRWRLLRRHLLLDQGVLMAKNLTVLF